MKPSEFIILHPNNPRLLDIKFISKEQAIKLTQKLKAQEIFDDIDKEQKKGNWNWKKELKKKHGVK